jgi:hypothetical protein
MTAPHVTRALAIWHEMVAQRDISKRVGDRRLNGIDLIRFDEHGKILELEVMVRPMTGLQALGAEMGKRLGHLLPSFKA